MSKDSKFRKEAMRAARLSTDGRSFYEGMVYSYGQFYGVLDTPQIENLEDLKKHFLKMAKELDIPIPEDSHE